MEERKQMAKCNRRSRIHRTGSIIALIGVISVTLLLSSCFYSVGFSGDMNPAWSPDGTKIAFDSGLRLNGIYVMSVDGSSLTHITYALDYHPAWSLDGARLAFTSYRDGNAEVYVMNADGSNQTRLTNDPANDSKPAWSPDGSKIAFAHGSGDIVFGDYAYEICEIYVMNTDGSNQTRITRGGTDPTWSPDGKMIAYATEEQSTDADIWVVNADGSNQTIVTNGCEPACSPDGTRITYTAYNEHGFEVYVMDVDSRERMRLTEGTVFLTCAACPTWSPDGTKIAFSWYRVPEGANDGVIEIWVMNADGSNQMKITDFGNRGVIAGYLSVIWLILLLLALLAAIALGLFGLTRWLIRRYRQAES